MTYAPRAADESQPCPITVTHTGSRYRFSIADNTLLSGEIRLNTGQMDYMALRISVALAQGSFIRKGATPPPFTLRLTGDEFSPEDIKGLQTLLDQFNNAPKSWPTSLPETVEYAESD